MIDEETVKSIEALHRLKLEGIISEEEFEKSKQRALFGGAGQGAARLSAAGPVGLPASDDHIGWATLALRRYADFNGRSCRKEFWMFEIIPITLTVFVFGIFDDQNGLDGMNGASILMMGILLIALAALAVPHVAAQVRRLHDQNRSGWLALLNLVPYIGAFIVLVLMALEGTKGENQYGPDPLAT